VVSNVHIPDGFLSTPVWAGLDAAAIPAVGYMVKRAQSGFAETRAPLLGVMGAFVFAAQMINFPVGVGTSGHLVGGALLAYTLGPPAAAVVMTAILAIQGLVFQDGGILALGANVLNMAVFGVLAAYLPFRIAGGGRYRKLAIFLGGFLSVMVSALLALGELVVSGVKIPTPVLGISVVLFAVSASFEGVITVAVLKALESLQPEIVYKPSERGPALALVGIAAVLLAAVGVFFASTQPDGLEKLAEQIGIAGRAQSIWSTPLADYEVNFFSSAWTRKAAAGIAGLGLIYGACLLLGRVAVRYRRQ
jgi:cobalt/nickel transport system permease protein